MGSDIVAGSTERWEYEHKYQPPAMHTAVIAIDMPRPRKFIIGDFRYRLGLIGYLLRDHQRTAYLQ
jgi:hypothetical protein